MSRRATTASKNSRSFYYLCISSSGEGLRLMFGGCGGLLLYSCCETHRCGIGSMWHGPLPQSGCTAGTAMGGGETRCVVGAWHGGRSRPVISAVISAIISALMVRAGTASARDAHVRGPAFGAPPPP